MGGAAATDYTVYTKKDLTLRRGEKAIVTLFTKKIRYSHIYRWSPPEAMEHSLVLHNATDTAWTTGPCLALSADRPLSEDLLKYTPKGAAGELPVTAAINIAHDKSERETDRKLKAHSPTRERELRPGHAGRQGQLRNYEKRTVEIVITNPIPGKPITADSKGAISVDPTKLKLLERAGSIQWTVKLEPGEEKTLTYQYERYVPSNWIGWGGVVLAPVRRQCNCAPTLEKEDPTGDSPAFVERWPRCPYNTARSCERQSTTSRLAPTWSAAIHRRFVPASPASRLALPRAFHAATRAAMHRDALQTDRCDSALCLMLIGGQCRRPPNASP